MEAQTVLGPVPADQLGVTLMHEHVLVDLTCYWSEPDDPADRELARVKVADVSRYTILGTPVGRTTMMILDNLVLDDIGDGRRPNSGTSATRAGGRSSISRWTGSVPARAGAATSSVSGRYRPAPVSTSWPGPATTSISPIPEHVAVVQLPWNSPGRW